MAIKWGSTWVTAVKWGNTVCTQVKWGSTKVFPEGGMSTSGTSVIFSPPIASGLWYNKPFYLASGTNVTSTSHLTDSNSYYGKQGGWSCLWTTKDGVNFSAYTRVKVVYTLSGWGAISSNSISIWGHRNSYPTSSTISSGGTLTKETGDGSAGTNKTVIVKLDTSTNYSPTTIKAITIAHYSACNSVAEWGYSLTIHSISIY